MPIQTATVRFERSPKGVVIHIKTPDGEARINAGFVSMNPQEQFWSQDFHTGMYERNLTPSLKQTTPKQKKRAATKQEIEVMEALGGRRQAGSGALAHLKGDGRVRDKYRVECKYTRSSSYRLDRTELSKIRGECTPPEIPLFVVDFVDPETGGSPDRWVAVEFEHFLKMEYQPSHAARHPAGPR